MGIIAHSWAGPKGCVCSAGGKGKDWWWIRDRGNGKIRILLRVAFNMMKPTNKSVQTVDNINHIRRSRLKEENMWNKSG